MRGVNSMESNRGKRKVLRGIVLNDKADKTIVVNVERRFPHPIYKKIVRNKRKFKVHDAQNNAHIGDHVEIMETRPLSKYKRWRLVKIISKNKAREPLTKAEVSKEPNTNIEGTS